MCVNVEVVDAPFDYNPLLGRSWTCAMTTVVSNIFRVLCFPHEGWIITVDPLSFSRPDPSFGESTVLMIENLQPCTVKLGVGLFPYLMGT
jgi:hypothetical protein